MPPGLGGGNTESVLAGGLQEGQHCGRCGGAALPFQGDNGMNRTAKRLIAASGLAMPVIRDTLLRLNARRRRQVRRQRVVRTVATTTAVAFLAIAAAAAARRYWS